MGLCPKCGTLQNEGITYCTICGKYLPQNQPQSLPFQQSQPFQGELSTQGPAQLQQQQYHTPLQQFPVQQTKPVQEQTDYGKTLSPKKKGNVGLSLSVFLNVFLVFLFIVQLIAAPLSSPLADDSDEDDKYNELQDDYSSLEYQYASLQSSTNQLQDDYSDLQGEYNQLEEQYNELKAEKEFSQNINVGHLLECCYADIRGIYAEEWSGFWWQIVGDDEDVILFAARMAEHDLGRLYWIDANDKYNSLRDEGMPENMNTAALVKLSCVPDFIGIEGSDTPATKVEKVLDFVSTWVRYEHDLNNEFLSPVETLSFRSGDCDDFAILTSALFELVGLEAGIVFVTNDAGDAHAMCLLHLNDLGGYGYYYFSDLTDYDLKAGEWILIEPQSPIDGQDNEGWMEQWQGQYFVEIEKHLD